MCPNATQLQEDLFWISELLWEYSVYETCRIDGICMQILFCLLYNKYTQKTESKFPSAVRFCKSLLDKQRTSFI